MENFIAYNEALIDERDQGIAEIGQQIAEVHEIFQVSRATLIPCIGVGRATAPQFPLSTSA